jgi:hypothetical protein
LGSITTVGDYFDADGNVIDKGVVRGQHEYGLWDAKKTRACKCDAGYTGIDCAFRMCPKGNDPLTTEDSNGITEVHEVQKVKVGASGTVTNTFFTLSYVDSYGHEWTTRPIRTAASSATGNAMTTAAEVRSALMSIPNHAIDSIEVTVSEAVVESNYWEYSITFNSAATQGNQNRLTCNFAGCDTDGCQPRFTGFSSVADAKCVVTGYTNTHIASGAVVAANTDGTGENAECSNRGICDYSTGICGCFDGYTGEACSIQTILV